MLYNNKKYTQNGLVIGFLKSKKRNVRGFSTKEITEAINKLYKTKYSTIQISKCLNRFSEKDVVNKLNSPDVVNMCLWKYKS